MLGSAFKASVNAVNLATPKKGRMRLQFPSGAIYDFPENASQATIDQTYEYDKQFVKPAQVEAPTPDLPSAQAGALAGNAAGTIGQGPSYNPDGSLKIDYSKAPPPRRRFSEGSKGALEALGVIQERIANATAPLDVLSPFGAVNEALKGRVIPTPFGDIPAQIPKPSGMVAGIAALPFDIAADAEVVLDPKTTWDQKLRATANILINTGAAELGALKGFEALKGAIRTKNAQSVRKALFDLSPAQQEQVMKALPANAGGAHYVVGPKGAVKTSQPKKPLGMTAEDIARSQKKVGPQPEMGLTGGTTLSGKSRPGVSTGVKNASKVKEAAEVHGLGAPGSPHAGARAKPLGGPAPLSEGLSAVHADLSAGGSPFSPADLLAKAASHKSIEDVGRRSAKRLGDILEPIVRFKQKNRLVDVKTQRSVMASMVDAVHDEEIAKSIIRLVPVDVMNDLVGGKFTTQMLLDDVSVFQRALAARMDEPIATRVLDSLTHKQKFTLQGVRNASEKQASGPVHADVQSSALKGEGQVPPEGRGAGVRQEAQGRVQEEVKPDRTNISLRESARFNMEPEAPDTQSFIQWRDTARAAGYDTQEGARKILDRIKSGGNNPTPEETVGLGKRLIDLHTEMAGMTDGPSKEALRKEALEIRSIRHTPEARQLAARAALVASDYSVEGIDIAVEVATGKRPIGKNAQWYRDRAADLKKTNGKIDQLEKVREKIRQSPVPKFVEKGDIDKRIRDAHAALTKNLLGGGARAMVDPQNVKPIAALMRAYVQKFGNNVDRALFELRKDLKSIHGLDHTNQEILDAFKGSITKRNVTEELLKQRRLRARATAAINARIAQDALPSSGRVAEGLGKLSLNVRMMNATARIIDQLSNLDEMVTGSAVAHGERPLTNLALRIWGSNERFRTVTPINKFKAAQRWLSETSEDVLDASGLAHGRLGGGGPFAAFAGVLDAPPRAAHELSFAAQRAQHLSKTLGEDFGDILDQIRDPDLTGPLSREQASSLHEQMKRFGDVKMHTDNNWVSNVRGFSRQLINRIPTTNPGYKTVGALARTADWVFFQFGETLVNLADKGGQYTNPFYAGGRALTQLATPRGVLGDIPMAVRAKQFSDTVRRGGVGVALYQAGYQLYQSGQIPDFAKPTLVETYNKKGERTGNVFQDEGNAGRIMGALFAVAAGAKAAQIDEQEAKHRISKTQADKLRKDMLTAPLTDTTIWGNTTTIFNILDPNMSSQYAKQRGISTIVSLFMPGQLGEVARQQDRAEGIYGRRSDGWLDEIKRRIPEMQKGLPVKAMQLGKPIPR